MRNWFKLTIMVIALTAILGVVFTQNIHAQEGDADSATEESSISLFDTIKSGGIVELVIILLSVAALALIIENFVTMKVENYLPQDLLMEYEELLDAQSYEEAMNISQTDDCMLSRVFSAGLLKQNEGFDSIQESVQDAAAAEIAKIQGKIGILSLIANLSPMLGLLGTVTGMIAAFNIIATTENPSPGDLARGISQALITTCSGLIVAIPVSAAYFFLRNRVSTITNELAVVAGDFLDRFRVQG